jgi:pseudouridine 5'-phosphatase
VLPETLNAPPQITHIIYDNDGLLLDTEPFYTKAHQILADRYGKVFDWTVKSRMIGLPAEDSAHVVIQALQLPLSVTEYLEERKHLLEKMFPAGRGDAGRSTLIPAFASGRNSTSGGNQF